MTMQYELSGVIVHRGSASKGHYYSLVRNRHTRREHGTDVGNDVVSIDTDRDEWFKIDDAHVTVFDHGRDMDAVAFGGQTQNSIISNCKTNDKDNLSGSYYESQPSDDCRDGDGDVSEFAADQPPPKAKKQSAFMLFYDRIDTPLSS